MTVISHYELMNYLQVRVCTDHERRWTGSHPLFALWTSQLLLLHFSGSVANTCWDKELKAHRVEGVRTGAGVMCHNCRSFQASVDSWLVQDSLSRNHSKSTGSSCNILFFGTWRELSSNLLTNRSNFLVILTKRAQK